MSSVSLNRRLFLRNAAFAAAAAPTAAALASPLAETVAAVNPPDIIKVAGIRMIPVAGGKYKVWTKKIGDGKVKILLLHGGPAFCHDYLEAMESFLPQAGYENVLLRPARMRQL